jgi:hypothetical protein
MNFLTYSYSEKYNSFVWTPMKTASSHTSFVLAHFDFITVTENLITGAIINHSSDNINFGHSLQFPPNHSNMNFICSMRHPYYRCFSIFGRRFIDQTKKPEVYEFEKYFHESIETNIEFTRTTNMFDLRVPDFVLRAENLYEDYLKIPFIAESKLKEVGILEDLCKRKVNKGIETLNPENYLTPSVKEKIYKMFQSHFDLFGYEK